jgi:hypothetical protein
MNPSPGIHSRWLIALLLPLLLPLCAHAVDFDAAGVVLKNGGSLRITGTTPLPPAKLYTLTMDLTGTANGGLAQYLGAGPINLRASLTSEFSAQTATSVLGSTLANLSGKLPATLASGPAIEYYNVISGTTIMTLESSGIYSLKLDKNGKFTGSVTHIGLAVWVGRKKTVLSGEFVATTGTASVIPLMADTAAPKVDLIIMANPHVVYGAGQTYSSPDGTIPPYYRTIAPGGNRTYTFLLRNEDTSSETINFKSSLPTGFSAIGYDGKTVIPSAVLSGSGYNVTVASGDVHPVNVRIYAAKTLKLSYNILPFEAQEGSAVDWASATVYVP